MRDHSVGLSAGAESWADDTDLRAEPFGSKMQAGQDRTIADLQLVFRRVWRDRSKPSHPARRSADDGELGPDLGHRVDLLR